MTNDEIVNECLAGLHIRYDSKVDWPELEQRIEHALAEKDAVIEELRKYDSRTIVYAESCAHSEMVKSSILLASPPTASQIELGKDIEIKRLNNELHDQARELERLRQRESDLLGDLKGSADAYDGLNNDYSDLLRVAVQFGLIIRKGRWGVPEADDVERFLATPAATALLKEDS